MSFLKRLRATWFPDEYHGWGRRQRYFEGWYFKVVSRDERHALAFIPGISMNAQGERHSFVQVMDGKACRAIYHRFTADDFRPRERQFGLEVGDNYFSGQNIRLALPGISGEIAFQQTTPWPKMLGAPGIMGWYAWVPFMECYHGVVSLDHAIYGTLTVNGEEIDFTGGRGYIEKDWGRAFPEAWIWFQSNHFAAPGTSVTGSIAIIPWVRTAFPGFIIGLWHGGHLYRFATYTGAKTERLVVTDQTVDWVVGDRRRRLEMFVTQGAGRGFGLLKGPDGAEMGKRINETLSATVRVRLTERRENRVLFEGTGRNAGLEVHEVEARLLKMIE